MPRFKADLYVKEILITSYHVEANDRYDALDKGLEISQDDIYLDIEELDD